MRISKFIGNDFNLDTRNLLLFIFSRNEIEVYQHSLLCFTYRNIIC